MTIDFVVMIPTYIVTKLTNLGAPSNYLCERNVVLCSSVLQVRPIFGALGLHFSCIGRQMPKLQRQAVSPWLLSTTRYYTAATGQWADMGRQT